MLNSKGEIEMDAIVIDGKTMNSGAVCGLRGCSNSNPVHVARLVMEKVRVRFSGRGVVFYNEIEIQ